MLPGRVIGRCVRPDVRLYRAHSNVFSEQQQVLRIFRRLEFELLQCVKRLNVVWNSWQVFAFQKVQQLGQVRSRDHGPPGRVRSRVKTPSPGSVSDVDSCARAAVAEPGFWKGKGGLRGLRAKPPSRVLQVRSFLWELGRSSSEKWLWDEPQTINISFAYQIVNVSSNFVHLYFTV